VTSLKISFARRKALITHCVDELKGTEKDLLIQIGVLKEKNAGLIKELNNESEYNAP
jgi:hypothetical protein